MARIRCFATLAVVALSAVGWVLPARAAFEQVPASMMVEGVLVNVIGEPVSGGAPVAMVARIYSGPACVPTDPAELVPDASCLLGVTSYSATVTQGVYRLEVPLTAAMVATRASNYFELAVAGVRLGRKAFASVAFAAQAEHVVTADEGLSVACAGGVPCVGTSQIANGTLTDTQVRAKDAGYLGISYSKLTGISPAVHTHTGYIASNPTPTAQGAWIGITGAARASMFKDSSLTTAFLDPASTGHAASFNGPMTIGATGAPAAGVYLRVGASRDFEARTNGDLRIHQVPYTWPSVVGAANTVLTSAAGGVLSWAYPTLPNGGAGVVQKMISGVHQARAFAVGAGLAIQNGNGVAGEPTVAFANPLTFPGTGYIGLPAGTTAQGAGITAAGATRFNSEKGAIEFYNGSAWNSLVIQANVWTTLPTGSIQPWASAAGTAPAGWAFCNGATLTRASYAELFGAIGTAWGAPSSTQFSLPNLNGRFLRGAKRTGNVARYVGDYATDATQDHTHISMNPLLASTAPVCVPANSLNLGNTLPDYLPDFGSARTLGSWANQTVNTLPTTATGNQAAYQRMQLPGMPDPVTMDQIPVGTTTESRPVNAAVRYIIKLGTCANGKTCPTP
jgi:microcystin-dependent protein